MAFMYNSGLQALATNTLGIKWDDAGIDIKGCLVTSAYIYDSTHTVYGSLSGECTNGGYSAGGNLITGRTCTKDDVNSRCIYSASNVTFTTLAAGDLPAAIVVYRYSAAGLANTLLAYCSLLAAPAPSGGDYQIIWNVTTGVFTVTNA
jgi:hypothetical protein